MTRSMLMLVVLAACGWGRGLSAADAASPSDAAKPAAPTPVSVVGWEDTSSFGEAAWLGQAGPDLLAAQLAAQPALVVLAREDLGVLQQEQSLTSGRVAVAAAATYVVGGSFQVVDDQLTIHCSVSQGPATLWATEQHGLLSDYTTPCRAAARLCADYFAHHGGGAVGDIRSAAGPPLSSAAAYYRGLLLLKNGENERAVADFARAVQKAPSFAPAWNQLGLALQACHHDAAAAAAFEQAVTCNPEDPRAPGMLYLSAQRLQQRNPQLAISCYRRIISDYPFTRVRRDDGSNTVDETTYRERAHAALRALGAADVPGTQAGR